jgi:hypothetical protein
MKAKPARPMWTKEPPTEKVHIVTTKPKVTHQDSGKKGVTRDFPWNAGTVLKTKWGK